MRALLNPVVAALAAISACAPLPEPVPPKSDVSNGQGLTRIDTRPAPVAPPQDTPDDQAVHAFAKAFLDGLQPRSVAQRAEYCGYFYLDADGRMAGTPPRRGTFASCDMPGPFEGVFASYHTHSAFDPDYDNEVPSETDLLSDFDFGIDGYVSTPGGRVWHVDHGTRTTAQICGLGCVYQDPGFRPVGEAGIRARFTLQQLARR